MVLKIELRHDNLAENGSDDAVISAKFIAILKIIDRSILPRDITFYCNDKWVSTLVTQGRVVSCRSNFANEDNETTTSILTSFVRLFASANEKIRFSLKAADVGGASERGRTVAEIVNAQQRDESSEKADAGRAVLGSGEFQFDNQHWPIAMPDRSGSAALHAAWQASLWTREWSLRNRLILGDAVLMISTSDARPKQIAIRSSSGKTLVGSPDSKELGHVVSAWRVEPS